MLDTSVETKRFKTEDLFFTRTDERGVIQSANTVFQHVSVYDWDELYNAPHKLIRHPEMPKGVFHLLWTELKAKRPFGGYVVNQTKEGQYYWVFAVIAPVSDGYLSVRLKPTGTLLPEVTTLYQELREKERTGELDPEASQNELLRRVKSAGYESYYTFMMRALSHEIGHRNDALRRDEDLLLSSIGHMLDTLQGIEKLSQKIVSIFQATKQIPHNMRLQAQRLEGRDGPLSVISGNHHQMIQSLEGAVMDFREAAMKGTGQIAEAGFSTGASLLMDDLIEMFDKEEPLEGVDKSKEQALLGQLKEKYAEDRIVAIHNVVKLAQRYGSMSRDIRRVMSGLEMTRIMCKIERSSLPTEAGGLDETILDLYRCERELSEVIEKIDDCVRDLLVSSNFLGEKEAA